MNGQVLRHRVASRPAVLAPPRYTERAARARRTRRARRLRMGWLAGATLLPCLWLGLGAGDAGLMQAQPAGGSAERAVDANALAMTPDEDLIYWQNLVADAARPDPESP